VQPALNTARGQRPWRGGRRGSLGLGASGVSREIVTCVDDLSGYVTAGDNPSAAPQTWSALALALSLLGIRIAPVMLGIGIAQS
jgi:hypothetical protein